MELQPTSKAPLTKAAPVGALLSVASGEEKPSADNVLQVDVPGQLAGAAEWAEDLAGWDAGAREDRGASGRPSRQSSAAIRSSKRQRIAKCIDAAAHAVKGQTPAMAQFIESIKPCLVFIVAGLLYIVIPLYLALYYTVYHMLRVLPWTSLQMVYGVALCFFGGTYSTSLAAVEAFRKFCGQQLYVDLQYVINQAATVKQASDLDDGIDADHDGAADVDKMTARELIAHKVKVSMVAVSDPERLVTCVQHLLSAYLAVLATLRFRFAWTTAFALALASRLKLVVVRMFAPTLMHFLGPELKHWANTIIEVVLKLFTVTFTWHIQMLISAFYSALEGGHLFAGAFFNILVRKGWLQQLPSFLVSEKIDIDDCIVDDIVAYALAGVGFCFQVNHGFHLPFPLDLAFLPLTVVEWALRFQTSFIGTYDAEGT